MKTQPPRPRRQDTAKHPLRCNFLTVYAAVAVGIAGMMWGCSFFTPPDSVVQRGLVLATKIASPLALAKSPQQAPDIVARSAIMIDAVTGETLYEKTPDLRLPVASTQKLLTAMVAIEEGNLEADIPISLKDALQPPTKLGLPPGSLQRRLDLLSSMLVTSANDAASALASNGDGSYRDFVARMNAKARSLGAINSHFTNPHGLDETGQFSTARDSAIIAYHAYRVPLIRHYAAQRTIPFRFGDGSSMTLENTNRLVWTRPAYFNGLKSGFTLWGRKCLVASAKHSGSEIIIVLLASTPGDVFNDARRLFKWHQNMLRTGYSDD
jgi:D-alanyl-D-alanine carboxypeptidase (penicillin-binding protein 5/6)